MWSARGVATHAGVLSCSAARAPQRARATSTGFFDLSGFYDAKRRDLTCNNHSTHDLQRPLKTSLQYKETIGFPGAFPGFSHESSCPVSFVREKNGRRRGTYVIVK